MRRLSGFVMWEVFAVFAALACSGCQVNEATIEGHDFLAGGLKNLRTALDEYHGDDIERMDQVRTRLAAGFAADVVAVATDKQAVEAKTGQFIVALAAAENAERIERDRYNKAVNSLTAMREVNGSLRDLGAVKLGWKNQVIEYTNALRKKVENGRSGN